MIESKAAKINKIVCPRSQHHFQEGLKQHGISVMSTKHRIWSTR